MCELDRGLAADTALVDHERAQPVGGAVDGGREPGRARADDDEVELVGLEIGRGAGGDCDLRVGGIAEAPPVRKHHQRKPGFRACRGQQPRPSSDSARQNACGTAQRSKTSLSS